MGAGTEDTRDQLFTAEHSRRVGGRGERGHRDLDTARLLRTTHAHTHNTCTRTCYKYAHLMHTRTCEYLHTSAHDTRDTRARKHTHALVHMMHM